MKLQTDSVTGDFDWRALVNREGGPWFRQFSIDGVRGTLQVVEGQGKTRKPRVEAERQPDWFPTPARIDIQGIDLAASSNRDSIHLKEGSLTVSAMEPGHIRFGQVIVRQPWLSKVFRDVKGTTAVQETRVAMADLTLVDGVKVPSASLDLSKLREGLLDATFHIAAFGGEIRGEVQTLLGEEHSGVEASGKFESINIAPLATFFDASDAAGGTIKEGNFSFRGSPRDLSKATASIRLHAVNFQWESRQWDSLVLGGVMRDRRIEIPELELIQGQNRLRLKNGEMELPTARTPWWQSAFSFDIAAKIGNLTELSALVLPEFQYAAGKVEIDGAIRRKNREFNGALFVSGSGITWRDTPIQELYGAVKISGNELHVASMELRNGKDFMSGRGVVNILGPKQYWGELRASVADLATYSALLRPPIVPEPLAGGAMVDWSGEGSAKGHSGKFQARLQKLRTLGATGNHLHPLQADLEGVYSKGTVEFSRFLLSDDHSAFRANVIVGNQALSLQDIRLTYGAEVWLEGNAVLPLDVWRVWPKTSLPEMVAGDVETRVELSARNLQLREASQLTGWKWLIEGVLDGTISANGRLDSLRTTGQVSLKEARLPLGWTGDTLEKVEAILSFQDELLRVDQFSCNHSSGSYSATGEIKFGNADGTALNLVVASDAVTLPVFRQNHSAGEPGNGLAKVTGMMNIQIQGPVSAAKVTGTGRITALDLGDGADVSQLWGSDSFTALPEVFQIQATPWSEWDFDVRIEAAEDAHAVGLGQFKASLHLTGNGTSPALSGALEISDIPLVNNLAAGGSLRIEKALLSFKGSGPAVPLLDVLVTGELEGSSFTAEAYGPLSHPIRDIRAAPPLTEAMVRDFLIEADRMTALSSEASRLIALAGPSVLGGDSPRYSWEPISVDEPSAEAEALSEELSPSPPPELEDAAPEPGTNP